VNLEVWLGNTLSGNRTLISVQVWALKRRALRVNHQSICELAYKELTSNLVHILYEGNDEIEGNDGDDEVVGENGTDILIGGLEADSLNGGEKSDFLSGGPNDDILVGGNDADYFMHAI
jgi:Ca2+-binding RTX toxin-like protein